MDLKSLRACGDFVEHDIFDFEKMTFLDFFDMHLMLFCIFSLYLVIFVQYLIILCIFSQYLRCMPLLNPP